MTAWGLCLIATVIAADPAAVDPAAEVHIKNVLVTLIEQVDVPAQDAGVLLRVVVKEGQVVEAGQLLGQIDDREAILARDRAQTDWEQARRLAENDLKVRYATKAAEVATAELKRSKDSVSTVARSISQTELDRLQLIADKAGLEIEQAQEDLALARSQQALKLNDLERTKLQVERRKLLAPLTGVVVQWKRHPGDWVEPGLPVVRVIRMHRLRAEGFATGKQLSPADVGRKVTFHVMTEAETSVKYEGELVFVNPEVDPVNGESRFWAEIDNPQLTLRPGQSGSLTIHPATVRLTPK